MNELKIYLKKFSELNAQILEIENKLAILKKNRDSLENNIIPLIESNNLKDKDIKIANTKFQYHISEKKDSFTQQYIKTHLLDFFTETNKGRYSNEQCQKMADDIFQYLVNKRNSKKSVSLKCVHIQEK
jgi:methylmalonyl-CoA mutase N-terminal domain/subunit